MLIIEIFLAILLLFNPITLDTTTIEIQEPPSVNNTLIINDTIIDPMPISNYIRPYNMTKMGGQWRAINGSSYIDPEHEVVQWYANHTTLNESGLYYLNDTKVFHTHQSDFDYENGDYWQNADYYLSHGRTGDCEDYAIAMSSILEAKNIPNILVCISNRKGWSHIYVEYYYNQEYYILNTIRPKYGVRADYLYKDYYKVWMLNKTTTYTTYQENWSNVQ